MSLSTLPLSYCTNVHPGRTVAEVEEGLDRYTVPVKEGFGKPLAAGLWLQRAVIAELTSSQDKVRRFAEGLTARGLTCHTLNAFPYGDFHSTRVKENVYLPDWSDPKRLEYTLACARVLSELLPEQMDGSISTLPLGFKGFDRAAGFVDEAARRLVECARGLAQLADKSGRRIRLAVEPEPLCLVETTGEAIVFFKRLHRLADGMSALGQVIEHVGMCYDVCHQAVEFEDIGESIRAIDRAGIRIIKIHVSSALELERPAENSEGREALRRYVEERYLHQTLARTPDGRVLRQVDLTDVFVRDPGTEWLAAPSWRVHFHVPVDAEWLGPLKTTRTQLKEALAAVKRLSYAPHLEVETYTWEVLPDGRRAELIPGLTRELVATRGLIESERNL